MTVTWTNPWSGGASQGELSTTMLYGVSPSIVSGDMISIQYSVAQSCKVYFTIYDVMGRRVKSIERQELPGYHVFKLSVGSLPAGIYFLVMKAGNYKAVHKFSIIR